MDELVPLVGAQHGAFFLAEAGGRRDPAAADRRLRAARRTTGAPTQYRLGQSLIGQVAKSKRPIVVDELPEGYVKISSGLGEAPPGQPGRSLPIVFEDQVLGVIELASFTPFTPVHRDFLEQLMETIGVNVNTIIANARTDALLEESQRLTAELQARSEELQASRSSCSGPTPSWRTRRRCWPRRTATSRRRTPRSSRPGRRSRSAPGSSPGLEVQVAVPREHVARAAHPAEQPAHPGPAAGAEPGPATSPPSRSSTPTSSTRPAPTCCS